MKKFIVRFLVIVGALSILGFLGALALGIYIIKSKPKLPGSIILEVNLETGVVENSSDNALANLLNPKSTNLRELVDTLDRASKDNRVVGLVAKLGNHPMGMAQTQDIRDAILRFRASKKFTVAFAETFGEFGAGNGAYYLASAFETIWLQPSGDVGLTGLSAESIFLRGTLDKLGIKPQLDHRKEYKNAMNQLTETKMTPAHKEATTAMLASLTNQLVAGIATGRNLTEAEVRALVDRGPFSSKEALQAKLVDQLGYRDACYAAIHQQAGSKAELLYVATYAERFESPTREPDPTIALVYGLGNITRGTSRYDAMEGKAIMGSDSVAAALRAATEDKNIKVIVFRVDSPGGSYVASDTVWQEVRRAKQAGKAVIVSMGNTAASGGYFVAAAADKIVAQPGTITGSIGVYAGKIVINELLDKVGVSIDGVQQGQNANIWSFASPYTPAQWERLQTWLDRIYEDFTSKVAEGRHLPKEKVLQVAKGRVWTGTEAKAHGLVDEFGGLFDAIQLAKRTAGLPETATVEVFPKPKGVFESMLARLQGKEPTNSEKDAAQEAMVQTLQAVRPVVRAAHQAGLYGTHGALEADLPIEPQ